MSSFTEKRLRATITLADDSCTVFTSSGANTLIVENLRMAATVTANARQATELDLQIWGMVTADMDALTAAWLDPTAIRDNRVTLEADDGTGYKLVFEGTILEAQPDYSKMPNVPFHIMANIRYFQQIDISPPTSFKGSVSIDFLGKYFAEKLNMSFVNGGASASLVDPYYPGTVFDQLRDACRDARVDFYFQGTTLVFTPLEQPLSDVPAVILSPTSGMLGYPMYTRRGLVVTAIFDPAFLCASAIEIQDSAVKGANGRWYPFSLEHKLSSQLPGGEWTSRLQCNRVGQ